MPSSKRPTTTTTPAKPADAPARRFRVVLGQLGPFAERSEVDEAELRALSFEVERLVGMGVLREIEGA